LDPKRVSNFETLWTILQAMDNYYVRIKEHAYLINGELCPGHLDECQSGKTSFVNKHDARDMLQKCVLHYDAWRRLRPVVFVGHAVDNDFKIIKERLGLVIEALDVVVATMDTQTIYTDRQAGYVPRIVGLGALLRVCGVEEQYLHNAGNDTVATMVTAILIGFNHRLETTDGHAAAYEIIKITSKAKSIRQQRIFGTRQFFPTCGSEAHCPDKCIPYYHNCNICASSVAHYHNRMTHGTMRCKEAVKKAAKSRAATEAARAANEAARQREVLDANRSRAALEEAKKTLMMPRYPFLCGLCIMSPDPSRNKVDHLYGHLEKDCALHRRGVGRDRWNVVGNEKYQTQNCKCR
jgi:hypothetical protein